MEVRWCILKWADLIFRPAEEELPKLKMALKIAPKFHTPVPETPVQPSPAPLPAPLPAVPKAGPKAPPKPRAPKQPKAARAPKAPKVIAPAQKPTQPPSRNTPLPSSQPAIAPAPKLEPTPPPSLAAVDDLLAEEIEAIEAESSQSKSSPKKKAKPKAHTSDLPTPTPPPSQQHTLAVPDAPVPATTPSKINLGPKKNKKHTEEAIDVTPVAQPKPTGPVGKNKKAVVEGVIDRPVTPSSASKGKGKATNGSSPATKTLVDIKKCKEILNIIRKAEGAWLFWYPVDIVAAGCPTYGFPLIHSYTLSLTRTRRYYDEIKNPIDMQTMETKLDDGSYKSMEQFKADFELMFRNCRQFNPPGTDPYVVADLVEKAFKKEWAKIAQKKMAPGDRRSLQALLNKIKSDET
jgi:transcription initiation factor TFIID subunit 2